MINRAFCVFACLSLVCLEALAEFDQQYFDRHLLGMPGADWTPVTVHPANFLKHQPLMPGRSRDLNRYFDHTENLAAVALKNGRVVYERYNIGRQMSRQFLAPGMSMTKTATGLTVGYLLCTGKIASLDDSLGLYSKTLSQTVYANVTIRNALQMASGVYDNRKRERSLVHMMMNRQFNGSNDQRSALLAVSSAVTEQGKISHYHSLDSIALGTLVSEITGLPISQVFYEAIYSKLGADGPMAWWMDRRGNSLAFGGLRMTTRDWARLGQYMIDQTREDSCLGKFILDGIQSSMKSSLMDHLLYGYSFWVTTISGKPMAVLHGYAGQVMVLNHHENSLALVISASSDFRYGDKHIVTEVMPSAIRSLN